jgi:hypothetical protein
MPTPKPKKTPSLKQVAKTYKKNTKTSKVNWDGAAVANVAGDRIGIGSTTSKTSYKPKARSITMGTSKNGKGATIKKIGKV